VINFLLGVWVGMALLAAVLLFLHWRERNMRATRLKSGLNSSASTEWSYTRGYPPPKCFSSGQRKQGLTADDLMEHLREVGSLRDPYDFLHPANPPDWE
jgi:hypothetical protein